MTSQLRRQVHNIGRRRAWVIWLVGLSVYGLAVFHRTSLGVAGILAAERFGISASQLATFTVVQLGVYAAMQIPVGVLLDRFGSRRLMLVGLGLMTVGQFWFAFAQDFTGGLAARVLLGVGDAMIFTSLLRLVALWFRVKQAPMVTQVTGVLGQLGAIAAASPLAYALKQWGWTTSFTVAASVGVVLSVLLFFVVKDSPYTGDSIERIKVRALARTLADVWDNPGTRLGLWVHFSTMFGGTVFVMLWGYPFLVAGQGLSPETASALLVVMTVSSMAAGPLLGLATARVPVHRSLMVIGIVLLICVVWAAVLLWPGRAPLWLLVLLVVVLAIGGPGSMVGFDLARTFHPSERLGRATGVVNIGGFTASLLAMAGIGLVLDLRAPGGPDTYTTADFKAAMSVQFLFWGVGLVQLVRYRRKGREFIAEVPGAIEALRAGEALLPGISLLPDDVPVTRDDESMHIPDDRDFEALVDELAARHADTLTREDVADAVSAARSRLSEHSHHPEFLEVLVARAAREDLADHVAAQGGSPLGVRTLVFVSTHDSVRSRIAAAWAEHLGGRHVDVRTAGPEPLGHDNPLVERVLAEQGVPLARAGHDVADDVVHSADMVIELGADVPRVPGRRHVRWDIADPHGQSVDAIRRVRDDIGERVCALLEDLGVGGARS